MENNAKILEFLYKKSNDSYNINQISRLLGISVGSAFKILKDFEKLGYVIVNKKNNALLYRINISDKTKEFYDKIEENENRKSKKRTKVMCTIGSASNNPVIIKKLVEKGMDVVRIDACSYEKKDVIKMIQNMRQDYGDLPILLDIKQKSKEWIRFALKNDLDFVSFYARNPDDIYYANKILGYSDIKQVLGEKIKIIAKIDRNSLRNYREIIDEAYGVIINRSELVSNKIEILPKLQKEIIDECNKYGKPVILAGNIFNSMIQNKQPAQSEVYNISNAVLEGISCLMMDEETSNGKYPIEAVETISKIIKSAESGRIENSYYNINYDLTHFIGNTVSQLEKILHIDALLIITSGGYSARMISSRKLRCKTIAATSRMKIFRQLHLLWGIEPLHVNINTEDISNKDKKEVILKAIKKGFIGKSDQIAIIASVFHSKSKRTNLLETHNVSEFLDYLKYKKVSCEA